MQDYFTKSQIIEHLKENECCPDEFWNQQDKLIIENKKIFCGVYKNLIAQFDDIKGMWELV